MKRMIERGARAMSARSVPLLFEDRCQEAQAVLVSAFSNLNLDEIPEDALNAMRQRMHHLGYGKEDGEMPDSDMAFIFVAGTEAIASDLQAIRLRAVPR